MFESAGVETLALDLRTMKEEKILGEIEQIIKQCNVYHGRLQEVVPGIKDMILRVFEDYNT